MTKSKEALAAATSYEVVAGEYYSAERHPTCANFREASRMLFRRWLGSVRDESPVCEVGAGKSIVAELLAEANRSLSALTLTDESELMLDYSRTWGSVGVKFRISSGFALPFTRSSFDVVVSCLGDPYNTVPFWTEVHRVLRSNGTCFFTTPSWEWAKAFRNVGDVKSMHTSVFELADGSEISLPSYIYPEEEQVLLVESVGFAVSEISHVVIADLAGLRLSSKLLAGRGPDANVVTGFIAKRR